MILMKNRLMLNTRIMFFEKAILKMFFSNFEGAIFKEEILIND